MTRRLLILLITILFTAFSPALLPAADMEARPLIGAAVADDFRSFLLPDITLTDTLPPPPVPPDSLPSVHEPARPGPAPQDTNPAQEGDSPPADRIPELPDPMMPGTAQPDTVDQDTIPEPDQEDLPPTFAQPPTPMELDDGPDEVEERELVIVAVWPETITPGYRKVESDSTNRWDMALNWADRLYRDAGVITYRTGRLGQASGLDIHSYENRHQELFINEMNATDPVTGQVNWNRLPIHKIESIRLNDKGFTHRANVNLREHYTVQPMTYLNFDEGGGDYRNLEFAFTHNLWPETNLELSFWDRRDGDGYPRNSLTGRQLVFKLRHNLSDRVKLRAGYINNAFDQEQSFGYVMDDPELYHFNSFNAIPLETAAASDHTTSDIYLHVLQRETPGGGPRRAAGIHYQTDSWELAWSQDTTAYDLRDAGVFAWQEVSAGPANLRARANAYAQRDRSGMSLTSTSWLGWQGSLQGELPLGSWLTARGESLFKGRNDGRTGYEGSAGLSLHPTGWLRLEGFGGGGSFIPDLQSLYWSSLDYQGNPGLRNESGTHFGAASEIDLGAWLSLGARADVRDVTAGIFSGPDGNFTNIAPYRNLSATGWLTLDSPRFEGSLSGTVQEFRSAYIHPVNTRLRQSGERLWMKGSIYWKNTLYSSALFVKAGVSGMISPGGYAPAGFAESLNRWQHGGDVRHLPGFHRMDLNVTARIRWFMLMMRFENVLDGFNQQGYFEADGYPMPGRRFIIGFRIVFTN